jgi:hypothetical protein
VLGVTVTVDAVDLRPPGDLVALCSKDSTRSRSRSTASRCRRHRHPARNGRGLTALDTTARRSRMSEYRHYEVEYRRWRQPAADRAATETVSVRR